MILVIVNTVTVRKAWMTRRIFPSTTIETTLPPAVTTATITTKVEVAAVVPAATSPETGW